MALTQCRRSAVNTTDSSSCIYWVLDKTFCRSIGINKSKHVWGGFWKYNGLWEHKQRDLKTYVYSVNGSLFWELKQKRYSKKVIFFNVVVRNYLYWLIWCVFFAGFCTLTYTYFFCWLITCCLYYFIRNYLYLILV